MRSVRSDHAAADDHDLARDDPRHAAEEQAFAAVRTLQAMRPGLHRKPTGDF